MAKKKVLISKISEIKLRDFTEDEINQLFYLKVRFNEKTYSKVFKTLIHEFAPLQKNNDLVQIKLADAIGEIETLKEKHESVLNGFRDIFKILFKEEFKKFQQNLKAKNESSKNHSGK